MSHAASAFAPIAVTAPDGLKYCLDNREDSNTVGWPANRGAVNGNKIQVWRCNGLPSQQWRWNSTTGTIQNVNGYCLDLTALSTAKPGDLVQLWQCNGGEAQKWHFDQFARAIVNENAPWGNSQGLCLDTAVFANGNPVKIWDCNPGVSQRWNVSSVTPAPPVSSCQKVVGPLSVSGTRVLQANGKAFVPVGITLSTPQFWPTTILENYPEKLYDTTLTETERQINAISTGWCGNTVRLQIEQDVLVGTNGLGNNTAYMDYIKQSVAYAESLGLAVVLNSQTEHSLNTPGGLAQEPMPTKNTEAFWHIMDKSFARDPKVIYDLFNEPRYSGSSVANVWNVWHNGSGSFVGMQNLATAVRQDGSKNVFWIEGPSTGDYLGEVALNPSAYAIHNAGPVVYAIHNPESKFGINPAGWDATFGNIAKQGIGPVVMGEFTNEAGMGQTCWSDAPTRVPQFLSYLDSLHAGLTAWTLGWRSTGLGILNANVPTPNTNGDLSSAKGYGPNYSCSSSSNQGAGQDLKNWFLSKNK